VRWWAERLAQATLLSVVGSQKRRAWGLSISEAVDCRAMQRARLSFDRRK
jgi:hypothetical protein